VTSTKANEKDGYGLNIQGRQKQPAFIAEPPFYLQQMAEVAVLNTIQMLVSKKLTENEKRVVGEESNPPHPSHPFMKPSQNLSVSGFLVRQAHH
jgi:hypothetical protein